MNGLDFNFNPMYTLKLTKNDIILLDHTECFYLLNFEI
jgi:hypothetical protein